MSFYLKPYFIRLFLKFVVEKAMSTGGKEEGNVTVESIPDMEKVDEADVEVEAETVENKEPQNVEVIVENIEVTEVAVETPKPKRQILPKHALICVGEYPIKILVKGQFPSQKDDVQPVFIDKSSEEIVKWSNDVLNEDAVSGLDANVETHFWYQILPYLTQNEGFVTQLRNKLMDNQHGALILASSWDGVGSAMLPTLISRLKEWNVNSVALTLLPSKLQPSDAHFNALSSMGICFSKEPATLILVGRDQLNKYVGVERNGSVMKGNRVLNCLVEMMLTKKTFVRELSEMSRSFGVNFASSIALRRGALHLSIISPTISSSFALVKVIVRCFGPEASAVRKGRLISDVSVVESSILAFSPASLTLCIATLSLRTSIPCCFLNSSTM